MQSSCRVLAAKLPFTAGLKLASSTKVVDGPGFPTSPKPLPTYTRSGGFRSFCVTNRHFERQSIWWVSVGKGPTCCLDAHRVLGASARFGEAF